MLIKLYQWANSLLSTPAWLIGAMDATVTSACKYCMALRTAFFVAGFVLLFVWWFLGLPLMVIPVALTWGERYEHSERMKGNIQ